MRAALLTWAATLGHLLGCAAGLEPAPSPVQPTVILVVGAAGETELGAQFARQFEVWRAIVARAHVKHLVIGRDESAELPDHDRLKQSLASEPPGGPESLWLVLIGHGTFDGDQARFNLRGPDLSAAELAAWLKPFSRPLVVVNTTSSSAPFLPALSGTNRVIVTATRSGNEQNFTRFGPFFAEALAGLQSDLDHDGQVSLLEAFLWASAQVAEFYRTEGRLATEHALIDDNGDGLGTPADWFRGLRAVQQAREGASRDGTRAHQIHLVPSPEEQSLPPDVRIRRDQLEREVAQLREAKPKLPPDDYYRQLEALLLELAQLLDHGDPPR
jgi:hypothetical protein